MLASTANHLRSLETFQFRMPLLHKGISKRNWFEPATSWAKELIALPLRAIRLFLSFEHSFAMPNFCLVHATEQRVLDCHTNDLLLLMWSPSPDCGREGHLNSVRWSLQRFNYSYDIVEKPLKADRHVGLFGLDVCVWPLRRDNIGFIMVLFDTAQLSHAIGFNLT